VGRWPEAVLSLSRAAALDPLAAGVHYHLGFASAHTGDLHRAREAWNNYLRLGDADPGRVANARRALDAADALLAALEVEAQ
jgi:Flp pilus assembly protein TadD